MTRLMADAINPANIPVGKFPLVAGYVDGPRSQWPAAGWVRHASSILVRIAVFASTNNGHVLDVETGDATPSQAPDWVQRRRVAGVDPSVYCSISLWPAVRAAFHAANVAEPHYWVAGYPGGGAVIPAGAIAHQYADPLTSGGNYDLSVVADYWPGVDQGGQMDWSDQLPFNQTPKNPTQTAPAGQLLANADLYAGNAMNNTAALLTKVDGLAAQITSLQGALTADEATLVGLLQGVDSDAKAGVLQVVAAIAAVPAGGQVDVKTLAVALAPLLPAGATPAEIADAVRAELEAALATPTKPPTGGTP